jgi:hypothetical protein
MRRTSILRITKNGNPRINFVILSVAGEIRNNPEYSCNSCCYWSLNRLCKAKIIMQLYKLSGFFLDCYSILSGTLGHIFAIPIRLKINRRPLILTIFIFQDHSLWIITQKPSPVLSSQLPHQGKNSGIDLHSSIAARVMHATLNELPIENGPSPRRGPRDRMMSCRRNSFGLQNECKSIGLHRINNIYSW